MKWIIDKTIDKDQIEFLRTQKLFLATPAYGGMMNSSYTQSYGGLVALSHKVGLPLSTCFLANESLVQRARNILVAEFLRTDCTHMMFIDADIGFEAKDVISMLLCDKDIIGGAYTKKCINFKAALDAHAKGVPVERLGHCAGDFVVRFEGKTKLEVFNPVEVKYLGTGFMLLKRGVFDAMYDTTPNYKQNSSNKPQDKGMRHSAYFECGIVNDEYLSEDYWFCHRAKQLNMQLWLAPWVYLTHTGTHTHEGCLMCTNGMLVHKLGQPE